MNGTPVAQLERRLLVLAPIGRDADLIRTMLRKDAVACERCRSIEHLALELERGASALLLAEEAYADHEGRLAGIIARQPPWSDLPVLLLTRPGADSAVVARAIEALGNVTLLERPMRIEALASAVRSALRARERQFQTRAHLEERETADRRKDQFLATLAHELRNPLAPIRSSLALLRLSEGRTSPQICEIMERQVNHMVRLVDDLMEVSRITRGKIELRREAVDLASIIHSAVETSIPLIDAAKHRLTVTLPEEGLVLDADAVRLAQVFSNLLNNAAKYTDTGGAICITARREDRSAVVTVTDTGIGIPAHALPGVFDMFAQVNARDSRAQSGLGIGLTLVRSLVEMHGGSVSATSEGVGRGSVFVVRLPLDRRRDIRPGATPASAPEVGEIQRVLVVDDNQDAANTLGALLQLLGLSVRTANDGPAALDAIGSFHPSVVVLDLGMPGMDGYEVARRVREHPDYGDIALVALTGWGQEKDRQLTEQAGFDHHLVKPVDIGAMQAVLASLAKSRNGPFASPGS